MRRQTENDTAVPGGSEADFRVDPNALPVRFAAKLAGARAATPSLITLSCERVLIDRPVADGVAAITVALPLQVYRGVAARVVPDIGAGELRVELMLLHDDPSLCIPLLFTDTMDDIVADWQSWARQLRLPLLLIEADGRVTCPSKVPGSVHGRTPVERRKRRNSMTRRLRFLSRRKTGSAVGGPAERSREIIARD